MIRTPCLTLSETLGELFQCQELNNGFTRIKTPYLLPDGDVIDLFYKVTPEYTIVTDLGETIGWLLGQTLRDNLSQKQDRAIQDILLTHDVELYRGAFLVRLRSGDLLTDAVMRLSQVLLAVGNLWFLFHDRINSSFEAEVSDLLCEGSFRFRQNETLAGRSGRAWRVDFHVMHASHSSLVQTLSTASRSAANTKANRILASWHDLSSQKVGSQGLRFISLFDDSLDVWSSEIISQLEEFSDVAFWSESLRFLEMLESL